MILITSTGEFLLYFTVIFFLVSFHCKKKKKKRVAAGLFFFFFLGLPYFYCRIACSSGLNCDQMEPPHEEQYCQERNLSSNMFMRDYRHLPCQSQQPVERNPNTYRSMRDYRNQWMSAPFYSVPPTYASPASPYYASTPQPP